MTVISKVCERPHCALPCADFLMHQGLTCKQYFCWTWYRCSLGCFRYFLPLAVSPLVLRPRSLDRQALLNILRYYLETSLWGSISSALTLSGICFYRNLLGRYHLLSVVFLPAYSGFQLSWFYPIRTVRLFSTATTQTALETWLRTHNHFIIHSLSSQTLIFMICSAVILHFKRRKEFNGFWFIQPITNESPPKDVENVEDFKVTGNCMHCMNTTCTTYILDGMRSYLWYGVPLDLLSTVYKGKMPRRLRDLKMIRFEMTAFFLSYVGIYRLSSCLLTRYKLYSTREHLLSAGLGGLSYLFLNKLTFSVLAFVLAVQAVWQSYCGQHVEKPENKLTAFLKNIPFGKLLIPFNLGYMAHCCIFHNEAMSKLARGFFRAATGYQFESIYQNLTDILAD